MAETEKNKKGLNISAIVNEIRSQGLTISQYNEDEVIRYGIDNLYPNQVYDVIKNSPTANGCVKRKAEFVYGMGIENGDLIVNRNGKTLNEVYNLFSRTYSKTDGAVLHFNVNLLGEIVEIQNVDIRYVRKIGKLTHALLGKNRDLNVYDENSYEIALWGVTEKPKNGFLFYFNASGGIYPICPMESSLSSAQFENEAQIFTYMFAKNGFSGSGVLKLPNMPDAVREKKAYNDKVKSVTDTRRAGSLLLVDAVQNIEGNLDNSKIFESFMPANVDDIYVNQKLSAREYILRDFNMPEILLGVGSSGMFNMESFMDAFNYYNNDTARDRKILEGVFNKFWGQTIFKKEVPQIVVLPLEDMVKKTEGPKKEEE